VGQNNNVFTPVPDFGIYESENQILFTNIIETKEGSGVRFMPAWLSSYIEGGIPAVERLDAYSDKYVFIGVNRGENFNALNIWADNFSEALDFPMLAAVRIENRIISTAALYPDNEYGAFFEAMVKGAYSGEYRGTVKNDTSWIKIWFENENTWEYAENYIFFVFITIDKTAMQYIIRNMMTKVRDSVTVNTYQNNAINRLRLNFFEGF